MGNSLVKSQLSDVQGFLSDTIISLETFLNDTTISQLEQHAKSDSNMNRLILSNLRKLLVFCEEGLDACSVIMHSDPFQKASEKKFFIKFSIG